MQGERGWFVVRFGMQVVGGKIYIHALLLHICITGGIRMGSVIRGRGRSGPEAEPRSGGVVVVYSVVGVCVCGCSDMANREEYEQVKCVSSSLVRI